VDSVEETWSNFKTIVAQASDGVVGYRRAPGKRGGSQMTLKKLWKATDDRKRIKQQKSQGQLTMEQIDDLEEKYRMKYREVKKDVQKTNSSSMIQKLVRLKKQQPEKAARHFTG